MPLATAGVADTGPRVLVFQIWRPVSLSTAYTFPSSLPKKIIPPVNHRRRDDPIAGWKFPFYPMELARSGTGINAGVRGIAAEHGLPVRAQRQTQTSTIKIKSSFSFMEWTRSLRPAQDQRDFNGPLKKRPVNFSVLQLALVVQSKRAGFNRDEFPLLCDAIDWHVIDTCDPRSQNQPMPVGTDDSAASELLCGYNQAARTHLSTSPSNSFATAVLFGNS